MQKLNDRHLLQGLCSKSTALTSCSAVSFPFLSPVDSHKIIGLVKCFTNLYLQELLSRWRISKIILAITMLYPGRKLKVLGSPCEITGPGMGLEIHFHSSHNQLVSKVPSLEFLMCTRSRFSRIYEYFYNEIFFLENSHHLRSLRIFNN